MCELSPGWSEIPLSARKTRGMVGVTGNFWEGEMYYGQERGSTWNM